MEVNLVKDSIKNENGNLFENLHEKENISFLIKNNIISIVLKTNFNSSDLIKFFAFIEISIFLKLKNIMNMAKNEEKCCGLADKKEIILKENLNEINGNNSIDITINNYTLYLNMLEPKENPRNSSYWEEKKLHLNYKSNSSETTNIPKFDTSLQNLFNKYSVEIINSSYNRIFKKNKLINLLSQSINLLNHKIGTSNEKLNISTISGRFLNFKRGKNLEKFNDNDIDNDSYLSDNFKKDEIMNHFKPFNNILQSIYSPQKISNFFEEKNTSLCLSTEFKSKLESKSKSALIEDSNLLVNNSFFEANIGNNNLDLLENDNSRNDGIIDEELQIKNNSNLFYISNNKDYQFNSNLSKSVKMKFNNEYDDSKINSYKNSEIQTNLEGNFKHENFSDFKINNDYSYPSNNDLPNIKYDYFNDFNDYLYYLNEYESLKHAIIEDSFQL